ncbi:MAG: UPF0104 family protein [Betaproteobacteria bacterium]|nr:MAG: UPF0104 family protein [Betaproteobacteria bacterium]
MSASPLTARRLPPLAKYSLSFGFVACIAWLLVSRLQSTDWHAIVASLDAFSTPLLLAGGALTALSYAVYCCFDLLGRRYTGHRLTNPQVLKVSFVSHAFGLNFGVAGVGFRFRLYSLLGVGPAIVARVYAVSVGSNWLGFSVLAGAMLVARLVTLPAGWHLGEVMLQGVGFALLAGAAGYLALCGMSTQRHWTVFGQQIDLPSLRFAFAQCVLSALNWLLIAGVLYVLLQQKVELTIVLGVLLVNALALAVADVPGGLGVTEAVFLAMLAPRMPVAELLAALVAYRAIYFLGPLALALLMYLRAETNRAGCTGAAHRSGPAHRCSFK